MLEIRLNALADLERNPELYVQERRRLLDSVINAGRSNRPSLEMLQEQIDHIRAVSGSPAMALKEIIRLLGDQADILSGYVEQWSEQFTNTADATGQATTSDE